MAERSSPYRRIAGHGTGFVAHARLYQGPDHFLQVSSTGFSETYKRFYFRDIQAIILENKPWRLWWSCGIGMLLLLFLAPASMTTGVPAAIYWVVVASCAVALLINWALGPSCACYIRTAVQTERLRALTRIRTGRAFVTRTTELVAQFQQPTTSIGTSGAELSAQPAERPAPSDTIP